MSNSLIEGANIDGETVNIGDNQTISMQVLQSVYNEITGKTEKLTRHIRGNHIVKFEDIQQINRKITQLYEQYNIKANNCTITIYHVNQGKEQFSSFERFEIYDKSSLSPCENIRLKYTFLIVLPKTSRPQSYDIEIDILSRAAINQRYNLETGMKRRFLLSMINDQ